MYVLVPMPCLFFGGGSTQVLFTRESDGWVFLSIIRSKFLSPSYTHTQTHTYIHIYIHLLYCCNFALLYRSIRSHSFLYTFISITHNSIDILINLRTSSYKRYLHSVMVEWYFNNRCEVIGCIVLSFQMQAIVAFSKVIVCDLKHHTYFFPLKYILGKSVHFEFKIDLWMTNCRADKTLDQKCCYNLNYHKRLWTYGRRDCSIYGGFKLFFLLKLLRQIWFMKFHIGDLCLWDY